MMRPRVIALLAAALVSFPLAACGLVDDEPGFMHALSYAGYSPQVFASPVSDQLIRQAAALGANWLVVIPQWYQRDLQSTEIRPEPWRSPTDASVRHVIRLAHGLGMHVMLKPFDDPASGGWRARYAPADWGRWFQSYTRFIDHYAELSAQEQVEALTVGVEYSSSDATRTQDWRAVIASVRSRYGGLLTYAADWPQYRRVAFWDDLDAIGIDAYFPLSRGENPSMMALRLGWVPWMRQVSRFAQHYPGKRVIFTEIGYPSRRGAAANPSYYAGNAPADPQLQARLYESVFDTVYREPWLLGLCWFWWDNPSVPDYPAGTRDPGFTPRGKPAESILRREFHTARRVLRQPV